MNRIYNKIRNCFIVVLILAVAWGGEAKLSAQCTDLIIGFTKKSGNDLVYDIGQASALVDGQTWNISNLLYGVSANFNVLNWGVLGDDTLHIAWSTSTNGTPGSIDNGTLNSIDTAIQSIFIGPPGFTNGIFGAGIYLIVAASEDNSWNGQTIVGTTSSSYINVYNYSPNALGLTSCNLYKATDNNSTPTLQGKFTLNANGVITYNVNVSSPVAIFSGKPTSGLAPLQVAFTNSSTGSFSNSVWSFGDGKGITNTTAGNVTNTYSSAGNYTVTLTVNGTAGSSTNRQVNYIVVTNAALPVAGLTGTPTNGFVSLKVAFTNTSTGSFTNSIWSFGDGNGITNTTGGNVTNTYSSAGSYTVTLTVNGLGGSATNKQISYVVVSPTNQPLSGITLASGKLVFNYTNGPIGLPYRILSSTNITLPVASWTQVGSNTFPNPYTNSSMTNTRAFFRLVSP